jgi:hypothetical protein
MCGIAGLIGRSKQPKASFQLMTSLFEQLELRGMDASGFWAVEENSQSDKCGTIYHDKAPINSSNYVHKKEWTSMQSKRIDLLLIHARATSQQGGSAHNNHNNHPFVSSDRRFGMVHNGNLNEVEFLRNAFRIESETDSEYILRIFEHGFHRHGSQSDLPSYITRGLNGIKDVWSYISIGAMSVALAERINDSDRGLWLFRNHKRPLWLCDLRSQLGQIVFFSSPDIWFCALQGDSKKLLLHSHRLIEFPFDQVWHLSVNENGEITKDRIFKWKIETTDSNRTFGSIPFFDLKPNVCSVPFINMQETNE